MIFSPRLLKVQVGDEVSFIPTDKGHNSEIIKGMLPAGAEKWRGKINKQVDVVFDVPGFYGYQCKPHANMGMIGLIVVEGDSMLDNLEEARAPSPLFALCSSSLFFCPLLRVLHPEPENKTI